METRINTLQATYLVFLINWWCHNCIKSHIMNTSAASVRWPPGKIWSSMLLTLLLISGYVGWQHVSTKRRHFCNTTRNKSQPNSESAILHGFSFITQCGDKVRVKFQMSKFPHRVSIPISIGTRSVQIHKETWELWMVQNKMARFVAHRVYNLPTEADQLTMTRMAYIINQLCGPLAVWLTNKLSLFGMWKWHQANFLIHSHQPDLIVCHVSYLLQIILSTCTNTITCNNDRNILHFIQNKNVTK